MIDDPQSESSAAAPENAPKPKRTRAKKSTAAAEAKEPSARKKAAPDKARKSTAKSRKTESAAEPAPKKKAAAKRKTATRKEKAPVEPLPLAGAPPHFEDPIGDVSDGEAWSYSGTETDAGSEAEAYREGVAADAVDGTLEPIAPKPEDGADEQPEIAPAKIAENVAEGRARDSGPDTPPARLERLQKILSQAGVASRRRAEEMIVAGRIMVNGQVVTTLGSKADPERDHIRVDGKLLHGAERHRYFVLNKPKGYVTTVSDPEGRRTVMEFVSKLGERVYPVGRLDYQSEGLLLMTNDGALANQLTRAASGVEKTYLVKVAGQPGQEELERLRTGVMIERGGPSDSGLYGAGGRVRTAPARIRQIRPGANPWFEVVLTEGRNRELRKMFSAIGHYVEKIRRVGYGPLALDLEPGQVRELTAEEVDALRMTAEGKLKPRRLKTEAMLPKDAGRSAEDRPPKPGGRYRSEGRPAKPFARREPQRERREPQRERREPQRERREPQRAGGQESRRYGEGSFGRKSFPRRGEDRSGAKDFRGGGQKQFGAGEYRGRREQRSESPDRSQREFRGQKREWQPRPRGERFAGDTSRRAEPGKFEERQKPFPSRGGDKGRGPSQGEFSERPVKRWNQRERPLQPGSRPPQAGRFRAEGGRRFGTPAKSAGNDRPGNFADRRSGRSAGGPGRFSSKGKPGGFRGGPRRGNPRPGGKRPS